MGSPKHSASREVERSLGRAIRARRKELGFTQSQLGSQLLPPVSHVAISDIERGKTKVGVTRLRDIALSLGLRREELLAAAQKFEVVWPDTDPDYVAWKKYWDSLTPEEQGVELKMMSMHMEQEYDE